MTTITPEQAKAALEEYDHITHPDTFSSVGEIGEWVCSHGPAIRAALQSAARPEPPDSVFQRLYDSEINFAISGFFDSGFDAFLGDEMSGRKADISGLATWDEAVEWLKRAAIMHYPNSAFAKRPEPQAVREADAANTDPILIEVLQFIELCRSLEIRTGGGDSVDVRLERDEIRQTANTLYKKLDSVKWGISPAPEPAEGGGEIAGWQVYYDRHESMTKVYKFQDVAEREAKSTGGKVRPLCAAPRPAKAGGKVCAEGWKLVPIEPTRKMLDRGVELYVKEHSNSFEKHVWWIYWAMLAAAPAAMEKTGEG